MNKQRLNILVYGAGAIGQAFGGFLSRQHEVTLLGRPRFAEPVRKSGLRVSGIWGRHIFKKLRFVSRLNEIPRTAAPFDVILICVKSYDTARAARAIRSRVGRETQVISLQNGLGNIEALHRFVRPAQVLAARVIFGVEIPRPGSIKITVIAHPTAVGETTRKTLTARARRMARVFDAAGLPAVACADVRSLLWAKVAYNAALNPLASLLECHYGQLGETALTRRMMDEIIQEIYAVARSARIRMKPARAGAYRKQFYETLLPRTWHHHPSMLQDLQAGKKTEIDAICGHVVRLGREHSVPTPVNDCMRRWIRKAESRG